MESRVADTLKARIELVGDAQKIERGAHPCLFRIRDCVKRDKWHDLCFQCFRKYLDRYRTKP
jgi:hypothetical protein